MKLGSKEANEALKNYKAEELAVELLLVPEEDGDGLAAMADKIVDSDLGDVEILGPSRYESSDIDWLKSEIARIEPITSDLELQVGSKLREMDQCLHISLISDNSEDRERLEILRQKENDLMDEFEGLRDAYEEEWYGLAMLKSRLREIECNEKIQAIRRKMKEQKEEREYNPDYDIPDEFFEVEESEDD